MIQTTKMAARLFISERTVESHVSALLRKLQFTNRLELSDVARSLLANEEVRRLPAPLELMAESSTFVGRQQELDQLLRTWRKVVVGETLVTVVTGEAGIGKSRLVAELAGIAHRDGGRVVLGACFEDTQTPYEPFVRTILDDVDTLTGAEVTRRAGRRGCWPGSCLTFACCSASTMRISPDSTTCGPTCSTPCTDTSLDRRTTDRSCS